MRAVVYEAFGQLPSVQHVPDPTPAPDGVVVEVRATGLCLSDWHGWQGHDPDIRLPHVPGHELAGVIAAIGADVTGWHVGDRVTVPFVCACGACPQCAAGHHQVCDRQEQPGFTYWGSFAEYVAIPRAGVNLVGLPEAVTFGGAASLGCRFATSFRALVDVAKVSAGEWVAVHGCGGVGLSAVVIARALGARVVAVDVKSDRLAFARRLGADAAVNAAQVEDVPEAVRSLTDGGAHVSVDALGSARTCFDAIAGLRKRGRHVQIGLMVGDHRNAPVPMDRVIAHELQILGSHGMQAYRYPAMLAMIAAGHVRPDALVGRTISLDEAPEALATMDTFPGTGVTVIDRF
ncbi:MAG TPA: zinc-dependent alcohol dehydrogenase family protein [Rhodothermales bacterium]|nr:zinc-dependent alcohol dehydrogenase family protein [Rhodothermales bacterium]